jgi:hypothetical protein
LVTFFLTFEGNLSKNHIEKGYEVLREIDAILKDEAMDAKKKDK